VPTTLGAIVARTRVQILAPLVQSGAISPDKFWEDDELLAHTVAGCKDLWRAVVDLHQDHFVRINTTLALPAAADALVGVPSDLFRILYLTPLTSSDSSPVRFRKAGGGLTGIDFTAAMVRPSLDTIGTGGLVYYALVNAGSPVMTPEIHTAPRVMARVPCRLVYVPTLPVSLTLDSINPIPGESDHALMAWTAAYALGKQNPDGTFAPEATWLQVYATEKESIKIVTEPRDASAPTIIRGVFDDLFGPGLSGGGCDDGW
jgi:hypothetical protein